MHANMYRYACIGRSQCARRTKTLRERGSTVIRHREKQSDINSKHKINNRNVE